MKNKYTNEFELKKIRITRDDVDYLHQEVSYQNKKGQGFVVVFNSEHHQDIASFRNHLRDSGEYASSEIYRQSSVHRKLGLKGKKLLKQVGTPEYDKFMEELLVRARNDAKEYNSKEEKKEKNIDLIYLEKLKNKANQKND